MQYSIRKIHHTIRQNRLLLQVAFTLFFVMVSTWMAPSVHALFAFAATNQSDSTHNAAGDVENNVGTDNVEPADLLLPSGNGITATIGDRVWYDTNGDGIQGPNELGAPNVVIKLYDGNRSILDITMSDYQGNYSFENLAPGDYYVEFVSPAGYQPSQPRQGSDLNRDSDADPATGFTPAITLGIDATDQSWDVGLTNRNPNIAGRVWTDLNQNGVQDDVELGFPDVAVTLYSTNDELLQTVTTNLDGDYVFRNVAQNMYYVRFELPSGFMVVSNVQRYAIVEPTGRSNRFLVPQQGMPENLNAILQPVPDALVRQDRPGDTSPTALSTNDEPELTPMALDEIAEPEKMAPRSFMPLFVWN